METCVCSLAPWGARPKLQKLAALLDASECVLRVPFLADEYSAQLAFYIPVFRTGAGFQSESAVSPKLSLGAETMRGLDQRRRQSGANRPQRGNLP